MSAWTHAICAQCWNAQNPNRPATRVTDRGLVERCCWCGNPTAAGIYVRADPTELPCAGAHVE